jgi:hypothetical protein
MHLVQSEKPITTDHHKLGLLECFVSTPQGDSLEDLVSFIGGAEKTVAFLNSQIDTNAKNGGRQYLRTIAEDTDLEKVAYPKCAEICAGYSPTAERERGATQKLKAQALDKITEALKAGKKMDGKELEEMLKGLNILS